MAGRRLLDVARIAQAAHSIAKQHIALRSEQLNVYNKTSTLAKAAKDQTDRVTLTVKAAIALADRLGEAEKPYANYSWPAEEETRPQDDFVTTTTGVRKESPTSASSTDDPIPAHAETDHRDASDITADGINSETFPTPSSTPTNDEPEIPPLGVDLNVFRTKRVSHMLGKSRPQYEDQRNDEPKLHFPPKPLPITPESGPDVSSTETPFHMRESRVPSSRIGRLWQYGGLGMSMAFGAVGESLRRATGGGSEGTSIMLSPGNLEKLVAKLSKMRGAALKLGQMISFQGNSS
jgi:aarF domain-containing kinase